MQAFNQDRCFNLALCLRLILFHCVRTHFNYRLRLGINTEKINIIRQVMLSVVYKLIFGEQIGGAEDPLIFLAKWMGGYV